MSLQTSSCQFSAQIQVTQKHTAGIMVDPVPIIKISLGSWHPVFEWNYLGIEEKEKEKMVYYQIISSNQKPNKMVRCLDRSWGPRLGLSSNKSELYRIGMRLLCHCARPKSLNSPN